MHKNTKEKENLGILGSKDLKNSYRKCLVSVDNSKEANFANNHAKWKWSHFTKEEEEIQNQK